MNFELQSLLKEHGFTCTNYDRGVWDNEGLRAFVGWSPKDNRNFGVTIILRKFIPKYESYKYDQTYPNSDIGSAYDLEKTEELLLKSIREYKLSQLI